MAHSVKINQKKCNGCGICAAICPSRILSISEGRVRALGNKCIGCGHCEAVCEQDAIAAPVDTGFSTYRTFHLQPCWLPYGKGEVGHIVGLMHSRRSCRKYLSKELPLSLLEDLVQIGTSAPSGTNSQAWVFTLLDSRSQVEDLGQAVADFYKRLNRLARNPVFRLFERLFGSGRLAVYYKDYFHSVEASLQAWENGKEDRLFHGATAIIIVGCDDSASCPAEDALLATQNILLAAHVMGLGTCLIGYAVEAIRRDCKLKRILKINDGEKVYAVIAVGYPAVRFRKLVGRKDPTIRFPLRKNEST